MSGYTVGQLLRWCVDDALIDAFARNRQGWLLRKGGYATIVPYEGAQEYLARLFASSRPLGTTEPGVGPGISSRLQTVSVA